jgi:tRNA(His) guanylyltransferase
MKERDKLGDRMKGNYENRSRHTLIRRMPVIVRVDGRAFHTLTSSADKPFDRNLILCMVESAKAVACDIQGFKAAYVQSDEASFLITDYDTLDTEAWFGYVKSKVETISAASMTAHFNHFSAFNTARSLFGNIKPALFDARAFNIPREEVSNYFLWRAKDWERNSVSMYARAFFSDKQLHGQGRADQHEMLHSAGKNWATDLSPQIRNGTWVSMGYSGCSENSNILPTHQDISRFIEPLVNCDTEPEVEAA